MKLTPLAVSVLSLLGQRPMHPYEMYSVMLERHEDALVKVRPGSLYHAVERLERDGLVKSLGTDRPTGRPERTVYEATLEGHEALLDWVRSGLRQWQPEFPQFPLALALANNLPADTVVGLLEEYLHSLDLEVAEMEEAVAEVKRRELPEAFWIENDYLLAVRQAERAWIAATIERLTTGELPWHKKHQF
ncbi:PadR family transcriptional regulator [Microlunatus endophyticus]|uniref:PadR family transcriptional regulator n=1 Tax=Microlunatus endophyticus TaxID=1716077 RepID=A0A917W130_9ACTN|nr:PadR family transcriptional regulator [Microlunatus endophyticus]GGL48406.1 PadR family transcriptional regulator [Microlunatus endophyticus]